jgi:hypothetical protein
MRLSDAAAFARLTKKEALPLVSEVGWTRPAPAHGRRPARVSNAQVSGARVAALCVLRGSGRGPLDCAGMGGLRAHAAPGSLHGYGCSRFSVWWRRAKIAAWTRSCRLSLVRMLRTWVLTVCSPIARSRAICRLL